MEINLIFEDQWENEDKTWVSGSAFIDGEYFSTEDLAIKFSEAEDKRELKELLYQCNGFFGAIHHRVKNST